jgi:BirA family transcriptional regulator, biotin operon repressor / biotin---[acetyl-CoA-carboxylase] ligase
VSRSAPAQTSLNVPILERLRAADGEYVALRDLGPDIERVHEALDALVAFGFGIERHPYLGAAYRGAAERLCPDQIEFSLDTRLIGRRVAVWNRVKSTNDLALAACASAANNGLVILAEEQTAGRGRRGRSWTAPPRSSILMSVVLFPPAGAPTGCGSAWLTALAAVATAEVVTEWTSRAAAIKWPNDVRLDGNKIAGILVERAALTPAHPASSSDLRGADTAGAAVVGIGLNVNVSRDWLPLPLSAAATSIQIERHSAVDRSLLARDLIRRLDSWYALWCSDGPRALSGAWRSFSEHLGTIVRVTTPGGQKVGTLVDLDLCDGVSLAVETKKSAIEYAGGAARGMVRVALADVLALEPEPP